MIWIGVGNASGNIQLMSSIFFAAMSAIIDLDSSIVIQLPSPTDVALVQHINI